MSLSHEPPYEPTPYQPAPADASGPTPEILTVPPRAFIPREAPVFGWLDILLVLFAAAFLILMVPAVVVAAAHALPRYSSVPIVTLAKNVFILVPAQCVAYLLLVVFIHMLLIARHDRTLKEALPWAWPRRQWITLAGAGVALAFAILLLGHFLPIPKELPIDEFFRTRSSAFVMLAFGVGVAPVVEELIFRGLLYPVLNRSFGVVVALVITSLGFAFLHASQLALSWAPLLSLFLVGLALTLVRARFQSVGASTLVHMVYNATLFGVIFLTTGGFRHMDALTR